MTISTRIALGISAAALSLSLALAPAAWLAAAVAGATEQRLLLADARGTVWAGSAVPVLTGGQGSSDASALPGRLHWRLGLDGGALALRARHACCLNGELLMRWTPGWGRSRVELQPEPGPQGEPAVVKAMKRFAALAFEARQAILDGDQATLARLINENFDLRRSICRLPKNQIRIVERARSAGASAKFAGSGGAIIGAGHPPGGRRGRGDLVQPVAPTCSPGTGQQTRSQKQSQDQDHTPSLSGDQARLRGK